HMKSSRQQTAGPCWRLKSPLEPDRFGSMTAKRRPKPQQAKPTTHSITTPGSPHLNGDHIMNFPVIRSEFRVNEYVETFAVIRGGRPRYTTSMYYQDGIDQQRLLINNDG